jgi:DNA-binding SARP family transcriptional activator
VVTGDQIALSKAVRVDVREFRRRVAEGDLENAAGVAHGELLAGLDGDWVLRARNDRAAELAGVLATLAADAVAAGDAAAAVAWARRRLELEPLSEAAHRELVRLLALSGDRPAALAAARMMAERLRRDLGVPPSAATRALVEDVRRGRIGRPAAAPAGPTGLPATVADAERPMGREGALTR